MSRMRRFNLAIEMLFISGKRVAKLKPARNFRSFNLAIEMLFISGGYLS